MRSVALVLAAWLVVNAVAERVAGRAVYMEGEIVSAQVGFPRTPLDSLVLAAGSPVKYRGTFTYGAGGSRATFEIAPMHVPVVTTCELTAPVCGPIATGGEIASWSGVELLDTNDARGSVENTASQLVVDLSSPAEPWVVSLQLSLDKVAGLGEWRWSEDPPLICSPDGNCAPSVSVPGSSLFATITAFRAVPEPGTFAMMVAVAACRRRKKS